MKPVLILLGLVALANALMASYLLGSPTGTPGAVWLCIGAAILALAVAATLLYPRRHH